MSAELVSQEYGKARVRLVKLIKKPGWQDIINYTVQCLLESEKGAFNCNYTKADNSTCVPTDTTKNTVYVLAKRHNFSSPEEFAAILCQHFLAQYNHVDIVKVEIAETLWKRMTIDGKEHSHAFSKAGTAARTVRAEIRRSTGVLQISGGVKDLVVLKTTGSGFVNFHKCKYTVLPESDDRILATSVQAEWKYVKYNPATNYKNIYDTVIQTIEKIFATTYSASVQATIWDIANFLIEKIPEIEEISFALPNLHHWTVDVARFGEKNEDDIFVAVDEPHGLIKATIRRSRARL